MKRTQRIEERQHTAECLAHNTAVLESIFSTYGVLFGPLTPAPGEARCICARPLEPVTVS
jgi:hypothetical protein